MKLLLLLLLARPVEAKNCPPGQVCSTLGDDVATGNTGTVNGGTGATGGTTGGNWTSPTGPLTNIRDHRNRPTPGYGATGGTGAGGSGGAGGGDSTGGSGEAATAGPANPYMAQASQLMAAGDRAGACMAAQRAVQQLPGDANAAGLMRLACDQRGGSIQLSTASIKRHEIDSEKYNQEQAKQQQQQQQAGPGRDPLAGDVQNGKQFDESRVAVPQVPLGTIAQPVTSYDRMMTAQDKINHGDYAEAAQAALEAILLDPRNVKAHVILAAALEADGKHDEALKAAEDGLKLAPQNVNLLKSKAAAQIKKKDYQAAIATIDAALAVVATDAMAHLLKAYAYGKAGLKDEMLKELAMAAALDPSYEKYLIEAQNGGRNGEPFVLPYDEAPDTYKKRQVALKKVDPNRNKKIALFFALLTVLFAIGGLMIYAVVSYRARAAAPEPQPDPEPVSPSGQ